MSSYENFHTFLEVLIQRTQEKREKGITNIASYENSHYALQALQRDEDHHIELKILLQFFTSFNRFLFLRQNSLHDICSDYHNLKEQLDNILSGLQRLSVIDSFSSHQDIYTIAYYTYHFILTNLRGTWDQGIDIDGNLSSMECKPVLLFTKKASRKRKRQNSNSSISNTNEEGTIPMYNNPWTIDSYSRKHDKLLSNILHLIIESLSVLKEILHRPVKHSSRFSCDDKTQIKEECFLEDSFMENTTPHVINYITVYGFADIPLHYYSHFATVLCRLAIPQCPETLLQFAISRSGVTTHFIRGCIQAFESVFQDHTHNSSIISSDHIQSVVKDSLRSIANKFPRERIQIISMLRQKQIMPDIFLTLLLQEENDMNLCHILLSEMLQSRSSSRDIIRPCFFIDTCLNDATHSILKRLTNYLFSQTDQSHKISWGEASLCVHTIALFIDILEIRIDVSDIIVIKAMSSLLDATPRSSENRFDMIWESLLDTTIPSNSAVDNFLQLSFCTCIILAKACFLSSSTDSSSFSSIQILFNLIFVQMLSVSKKAILWAHDLLKMLDGGHLQEFQDLLGITVSYASIHLGADLFNVFCKWSQILLHSIGATKDRETKLSIIGTLSHNILNDPQQCHDIFNGVHPLSSSHITDIMAPTTCIPLVTPLQLEKQERVLGLNSPCLDIFQSEMKRYYFQYILQVLYHLLFLEKSPSSPFATIALRELCLPNILFLVEEAYRLSQTNDVEVLVLLYHLIAKHCPDFVSVWKPSQHSFQRVYETFYEARDSVTALESSILKSLGCQLNFDENLFFIYRAFRPSLEVKVVKTLLESIENKRLVLTYKSLVEDPLQILKIHLAHWLSSGIRNVLVSILQRLFIAHSALSMKRCPSVEVVNELLFARDAITLKCFITLLTHRNKIENEGMIVNSGTDGEYSHYLSDQDVLSNGNRWLLAQRRGLFTYFCQDFVPDQVIESAPECALEFITLSTKLTKCEVKVVDRLNLSEISLRVVALVSAPGPKEVLLQSVLGFIASLTFHTESSRASFHYSTALRILSSVECLPSTSVGMVEIINEARSIIGKMQGNYPSEATCGPGHRRKVMIYN